MERKLLVSEEKVVSYDTDECIKKMRIKYDVR